MTIDVDNPRRLEFIGNGSDINWPYNYLIFDETNLLVLLDGITQIVNADYTVTGVDDQGGGDVVFTIAPPDQSEIIINSAVPATQNVDFEVGGKFKPDTVNDVNDKLTVIDQQTQTLIRQRGVLYPEAAFLDTNGKDNILPPLAAKSGNLIPIWSKDANNNIVATALEEGGDVSSLRAELASETELNPGTGLIGYFDENDPGGPTGKTLDALLKAISPLIDDRIAVVNAADPTKKVRFDASQIASGTTAVFTFHGSNSSGLPTGTILKGFFVAPTPPATFVFFDDGKTLGNAASGATLLADESAKALFYAIWHTCMDVICPVLPGGRGASADADFDANKTIALNQAFGRAMGFSGAGAGLTPRINGVAAGQETHMLTIAEMPSHTHEYLSHTQDQHALTDGGTLLNKSTSNETNTTSGVGGGGAHNIIQPTVFFPAIVKL